MKMPYNLSLTQLGYLLAVDETRNFREAAKKSFVTQPTLSMQIHKLEKELGVLVFDRSKQPVVPTDVGEEILKQAKTILKETAKFEQIISDTEGVLRGEFRLGIVPTLSQCLVPTFLLKFSEKYPEVELIVEEMKTNQLSARLTRDEIDAAIAVTPFKVDGIECDPLFYEPFYLIVPPDHKLAKKRSVTPSDLCLSQMWLLDDGHCFREQVFSLCEKAANKKNPEQLIRFKAGSFSTLVALVEQGKGTTLVPHLVAEDLCRRKANVVIKMFSAPKPTREVSLVYRRYYKKCSILRALQAEIESSVPKELRKKPQEDGYVVDVPHPAASQRPVNRNSKE